MLRPLLACSLVALISVTAARSETPTTKPTTVPVTITGGHDTDGRDRGRPVSLIAAALGVEDAVFRDAFSGVHPANGNGGPTPDEARANKRVLLDKLSKYGVTNERLDEVSNYYRYRRENGETWRQSPAEAYATLVNGHVSGIVIVSAGAGYSSTPKLAIASQPTAVLVPKMAYGKDLATNGSIASVTVAERR